MFNWHASPRHKTVYAVRTRRKLELGTPKAVSMHRFIMGEPPKADLQVDHIDGNGLNNQRANLRWVTGRMNQLNSRKHRARKDGTFGFYKITNRKTVKYQANIWVNGKEKYLGLYKTPQEAQAAYLGATRLLNQFTPEQKACSCHYEAGYPFLCPEHSKTAKSSTPEQKSEGQETQT